MGGVDQQEGEQPQRQGHDEVHPPSSEPAQRWVPEQPEGHRQDADVDADQRQQPERPGGRARALDRHLDGVVEGHPGGGQQPQLVRLAVHPGVGDEDAGAAEVRQLAGRPLLEGPVGLVDHHLGDGHRVGAVVDHRQLEPPIGDPGAGHHQLLDRRRVAAQRTAGIGRGDQPDEQRQRRQRHRRQERQR